MNSDTLASSVYSYSYSYSCYYYYYYCIFYFFFKFKQDWNSSLQNEASSDKLGALPFYLEPFCQPPQHPFSFSWESVSLGFLLVIPEHYVSVLLNREIVFVYQNYNIKCTQFIYAHFFFVNCVFNQTSDWLTFYFTSEDKQVLFFIFILRSRNV